MPLYEYECETCGHRFEQIQKFSDPPADTCPKCGGSVRKLLSSPAIQFKGSGWYITDYARKGGTGQGKVEKPTESSAPETKPASETKGGDAKGSATSPPTTAPKSD